MKKGFTLVELLGVLIVLGLIALVTVPIASTAVKDSKNKLYNSQVERIIEASKKYVLENIDNTEIISKDLYNYVSLETLKTGGYLENRDIKDPRTKQVMDGCVTISYSSNKFNYEYSDLNCVDLNEGNAPTITILNNEYNIKVEVNSTFDLTTVNSKVSATSHSGASLEVDDPKITKNGKVVSSIDTSILNAKYVLTYNVTDPSNNLSNKTKINIIINDTEAPTISVLGSLENQSINITLGERYTIPDAVVTDNSGETIEPLISGTVNTDTIGSNIITYKAVDSSGNVNTYILTVNVVE